MTEKQRKANGIDADDVLTNRRMKILTELISNGDNVIYIHGGVRRMMVVDRIMRFSNGRIFFRLKSEYTGEECAALVPITEIFPIYSSSNEESIGEVIDVDCARSRYEKALKHYEPTGASTNTSGCRGKY